MRLSLCAALGALPLTACVSDDPILNQYGPPTQVVAVSIEYSRITKVDVHLHSNEQRAAIKPSGGDYFKERWDHNPADFVGRPAYKAQYANALLQVLQDKGLTCEVSEGAAFAMAFMYEFKYRCD